MAYEIAEDKNAELAKNTKSNDKTSEKVNVMPKDETTEEIETNTKEIEPSEIIITHGYSKDARKDCKQFVQELLVSSDGDVPLMFKAHSGNEADITIFKERLKNLKQQFLDSEMSDLIPKFIVGDSKFYSLETLKNCKKDNIKWITRVPDNIIECKNSINQSLDTKNWIEYHYNEEKRLKYQVFNIEREEIKQRLIVVMSDYSEKRAEKAVERQYQREKESITQFQKKQGKEKFSCESDLKMHLEKASEKYRFFKLNTFTTNTEIKHLTKGRPSKSADTKTLYFA